MAVLIATARNSRGALAAIRSLGRAGWRVGVASPEATELAARSRWCTSWHHAPAANADDRGFLAAVRTAVEEYRYEVVFGAGDAEVLALSSGREALGVVLPYGPHRSVLRALDKMEVAAAAARVGLRTPRTVPANEENLRSLRGPIVVKAAMHWRPGLTGAPPRLEAAVFQSVQSARAHADRIRAVGGQPLLQEALTGALVALAVLRDRDGRTVAAVQQRAERTWPSPAGVSARAVTIPVDQPLSERVGCLLADLDWFGVAEVQFIWPAGGDPVIIDLNGRFYGSMALAIAAGVDLPALWADLTRGRSPRGTIVARSGVRYQWLEGDLRRAFVEGRGGLVRDVAGCLLAAPISAHSIWSGRDARPALGYLQILAGRGMRKMSRRFRHRGVEAASP